MKTENKDPLKSWVAGLVVKELDRAEKKHDQRFFINPHHGYAVVLEELDELWDEIKADSGLDELEKEAIQLAAMSMKFIMSIRKWRDLKMDDKLEALREMKKDPYYECLNCGYEVEPHTFSALNQCPQCKVGMDNFQKRGNHEEKESQKSDDDNQKKNSPRSN